MEKRRVSRMVIFDICNFDYFVLDTIYFVSRMFCHTHSSLQLPRVP